MPQIFGDFIETFPPDHDALELTFTPTSQRIQSLWRNRRLSAHFVADYFTNFLPSSKGNQEAEQQVKAAKGAISYVANELLENAMKFNLATVSYKVKFGIHFLDTSEVIAVLFASNSIDQVGAEKFQAFIRELLATDPEAFYMRQIEASAEAENADMSGLGFLTMINDYQAKLGWRFEPLSPDAEVWAVTTMAQIQV